MILRTAAAGFLLCVVAQDRSSSPRGPTLPVLDFPEPGLDDTASYQGYQTRFYRDSRQNTVQIYLDRRAGRVVNLLANAANESAGFSVRDVRGRPVRLKWGAKAAELGSEDRSAGGSLQAIEYRLEAEAPAVELGWFVLGSMRIERDFQYAKRQLQPYTAPPFVVAEESLLVADIARLPAEECRRHLEILAAEELVDLRARLYPTITPLTPASPDTQLVVRIARPSLDGRNTLALELRADARQATVHSSSRTVTIRGRSGATVRFAVRVLTDAASLSPLQRNEIFNRRFLDFLTEAGKAKDSAGTARYRRLERQVRGVELLSSKEKLMAGLPNFATYFGRDMMMTALMMRPIWTAGMSEHVIASVLRKLGPRGDVSHEEALGGQAIRENAVVYDSLIRGGRLEEARAILADLQKTRENYHMIDDEFQLPVLAARYFADTTVTTEQKRAFLLDSSDGRGSRLALLLKEMALVATWTRPYVDDPRATTLVSFPRRDASHWRSASWRDSDAGYAGGRFAMDINVIWVPAALRSVDRILGMLPSLGVTPAMPDSLIADSGGALAGYLRDRSSLRRAIATWDEARRHFRVSLTPAEIRRRTAAKRSWLPAPQRRYWERVMAQHGESRDSITFLALSLDSNGRPIPVVNTDPATELFLNTDLRSKEVLEEVAPFLRPYPVGLFVEGLGSLATNDAYASRPVWERFEADQYHGPRVVWGREVNLLLLGLANQISTAADFTQRTSLPVRVMGIEQLEEALHRTLSAVNASGLQHNELWSYQIKAEKLVPVRYGTSSDVQLWNTTDLAVEFVLSRLPKR